MTNEELELAIFGIISYAGQAKSSCIQAMQMAKAGDFTQANANIQQSLQARQIAQEHHLKLVQTEAENMQENGSNTAFKLSLLLVHAEDQLISAETIELMAKEIIDLHQIKHK